MAYTLQYNIGIIRILESQNEEEETNGKIRERERERIWRVKID
jgi:hypothetical protein